MEPYDSIAAGNRLREERERLGYNQTDFGGLANATRQTQARYELGKRIPGADYLGKIAEIGADVLYIVTGMHVPAVVADDCEGVRGLSSRVVLRDPKEVRWLEWYRQIPEDQRRYVEVVVEGFAAGKQAGEDTG